MSTPHTSEPAKFVDFSQPERQTKDINGTIWHYFGSTRRNSDNRGPHAPVYGDAPELVIGLDTEYTRKGRKTNQVLSYQFFASTEAGEWKGIHYPEKKRRISLSQYISAVIQIGLKEGILNKWPKATYLCAHYAVADFPAFSDLAELVARMDSVRRTFLTLKEPLQVNCYNRTRGLHKIEVHIRDSMLLAPSGKASLGDLGDILGIKKIALDPEQIGRMDILLKSDKPLFEEYALRDSEITVRYCEQMRELNWAILNDRSIPFTLSSMGIALLFKTWEKSKYDVSQILGKETVVEERFNGKYVYKKNRKVSRTEVHLWESLATECYHGGRNEQYTFGAGRIDQWTDWDLCGAYTTAMALLGLPDWSDIQYTRNVDEYRPSTLGFALVEFKFPTETRFPCLPVRTPAGLIFPLEGQSHCCAPEIYLAVKMGALVKIRDGIIIPQSLSQTPFADFIGEATRRRKEHKKGSVFELAWKELGNATYGKTAQGLRPKRVYSTRVDTYDYMPPSAITNPFYAAWVTSFVRAVLGEILACLPSHVSISNATTDGLLCTASKEEMDECVKGELCQMFLDARFRITGKREIVEAKHTIEQPLGMRTRGQLTLKAAEGFEPVLAKAGVKPPTRDKAEQNEWMINLFVTRTSKSVIPVSYFRSIADICRHGGDLTPVKIRRAVRLDFDWKRAPFNVSTTPIKGMEHIAFDTRPWRNATEAIKCREDWAQFSKSRNIVLKTEKDLNEFQAYRQCSKLHSSIPRKGGVLKLAAREFLRAYVRSLCCLRRNYMSYRDVAKLLTKLGVKTTKDDVDNAARKNVVCTMNSIPRTPETIMLYNKLKDQFPEFLPDVLLMPPDSCSG